MAADDRVADAAGAESAGSGTRSGDPRWVVYVLLSCDKKTTYVGVSSDAERRLEQHNGLRRGGAKATRAGRPWTLGALYGPYGGRGEAQRVEHRVKRLTGRERLRLTGEPRI